MTDPLHSPRRRLRRAEHHLRQFIAAEQAFFNSQPCTELRERNADGTQYVRKLKFHRTIPDDLVDSAVDALGNMRSALDQTTSAIARASGTPEPKSAYFPFASKAADLDKVIRDRCKNLPAPIHAVLRSFQPYPGGNDALWALNKIRVTNEHHLLIPMVLSIGQSVISIRKATGAFGPYWDAINNEIIVCALDSEDDANYYVNFRISVAFDYIDTFRGQPAGDVMDELLRHVDGIAGALEAEARRIGVFT